MAVIEGFQNIRWAAMRTLLSALKLEIAGLKVSRGRTAYSNIKRTYGLTGSRQRVYDQFAIMVEDSRPINRED